MPAQPDATVDASAESSAASAADSAADAVTRALAGEAEPFAADRRLELPMTLISRTVKRTAQTISAMETGQVLAVVTDDP